MIELRPDRKTGYCPLCKRVITEPGHFHTGWQILLWFWDGSLAAKLAITTAGVWLTGGLAYLMTYLRETW